MDEPQKESMNKLISAGRSNVVTDDVGEKKSKPGVTFEGKDNNQNMDENEKLDKTSLIAVEDTAEENVTDKARKSSLSSRRQSLAFARKQSRANATEQQNKLFAVDNLLQLGAGKLLSAQSDGTFTYRCIDCCHNPRVCARATVTPCVVNGEIAADLGTGDSTEHCRLCLLSPCFIGSYWSVGKNKIRYRTKHSIPGLSSDDYVLSCVCPCCIIAQLKNQLDAEKSERDQVLLLLARALQHGDEIIRT